MIKLKVNGLGDLAMEYKELIGKECIFIKKTRAGLCFVREIETGRLYSIPLKNCDILED